MNQFKILSLKEENELSTEELRKYYLELKEYVLKRKLTNTTKGAMTIAPKLKNATNKIARKLVQTLTTKNVEIISDGQENIPDGPVIFAQTHQGLLDNFAWIPETPKHTIILHSAVVKKFLVLAQLNTGLILVHKDSKEDRQNAKLDMLKILYSGHSIAIFPESAWNLSPNKLHLPLNYGFIDLAKKTGVPIIPIASEYTYDFNNSKPKIVKIHIKYGKPIYVSIDDNLLKKLDEYEEAISTMKYELIEEKGLYERNGISNSEYKEFLNSNIKDLQLGGIDINVERKYLFDANNDFYKFHHINDFKIDANNNFIETDEVVKIKKINKEHGI